MPLFVPDSDYRRGEIAGWSGGASNTMFSNYDRAFAFTATACFLAASGVMTSGGIWLPAGYTINGLAFRSGTIASGTPTNWWFALYNPSKNLVIQTADQGAAAWAAHTEVALSFTAAQTLTLTGLYYWAIMVKATTVPNMNGCAFAASSEGMSGGLVTTNAFKGQSSGSALTTTAPASIATPTEILGMPYVETF